MTVSIGHNNPPSDVALLEERLNNEYGAIIQTVEQMFNEPTFTIDEIANEDDEKNVVDSISRINKTIKDCESYRKTDKEPFLRQGQAVDSFWSRPTKLLDLLKKRQSGVLTVWQNKKAAAERLRREEEARKLREIAEQKAKDAELLQKANMPEEAEKELQDAITVENTAHHIERTAQAGKGLGVSHGTYGATASIRTVWEAEIISLADLDLEVLRPYIPINALQQALNGYKAAGGREIKGARIYQKSVSVVR